MNTALAELTNLSADELRAMVSGLMQKVASNAAVINANEVQIKFKQALIHKLTHENAVLKRLKFGLKSEKMNAEQRSLLDETLDADLLAVSEEIAQAVPESPAAKEKQTLKRQALPAELPRRIFTHEPDSAVCTAPGCGRPSSALVKRCRRCWTTCLASSVCTVMCAANGPALVARP